jgi:cyclase
MRFVLVFSKLSDNSVSHESPLSRRLCWERGGGEGLSRVAQFCRGSIVFFSLLFSAASGDFAFAAESGTQRIFKINDHLLAFYDGRDPSGKRYRPEWNWVDDGAMKLGVATYAIHKGEQAIVFDTFTSVEQARWVRTHLEKLGIRRCTVVLSHWHMDHVGGNAVYQDSHIIAPEVGRATQVGLKDKIEAGEVFGPPGIKPREIQAR